jgi:serine/threonine protein kinase
MPAPTTVSEFVDLVRKSGVVDSKSLDSAIEQLRAQTTLPGQPKELAGSLVQGGTLTHFQAEQLLRGKWQGFSIGKCLILERLGSGGMGIVYLGEHKFMRRRVAIKVLPLSLASDPWFIRQFYQEAQAVAALDHPNIVRAHDLDRDGSLHFLVMEYVDGSSLHDVVTKGGPLSIVRAAHYIRQAALGLQHAHEVGLVHRDIKPGNLLLSRQGLIKILDLGLARAFRNKQNEAVNKHREKRMVGTDDFLAPEQIVDSDDVDIRADIYSLGATFYFLLTGKAPFHDVDLDHHKLIGHVTRQPKPIRDLRAEIPDAMAAIVSKMMAKNPWSRFRTPANVAEALVPWTQTPIPPPPASEMPQLSLAARRGISPEGVAPSSHGRPQAKSSWVLTGTQGSGSNSTRLTGTQSQSQTTTDASPLNRPRPEGSGYSTPS